MKTLATLCMVGSVLALSACAGDRNADYSYETAAPYASERTVGAEDSPVVKPERTFESRMRK